MGAVKFQNAFYSRTEVPPVSVGTILFEAARHMKVDASIIVRNITTWVAQGIKFILENANINTFGSE